MKKHCGLRISSFAKAPANGADCLPAAGPAEEGGLKNRRQSRVRRIYHSSFIIYHFFP
jgi:hypothetical protein